MSDREIMYVDVGNLTDTESKEYISEIINTETFESTGSKRKLASVRRISEIRPIEGADRIVLAIIDGWQMITQISNGFKPGDLVVYFEIDSFLPVEERYEFLRHSSFKSTKNLGDGFRIKTMKMKKELSQGLILPLSEFFKFDEETGNWLYPEDLSIVYEGDDITGYLGVQKYEKPIPSNLQGKVRGNFPSFIRKTDQERIQNLYGRYSYQYSYHEFEATLKLDGSSLTAYHNNDNTGICSRNWDLDYTEDNLYWQVANKYHLTEILKQYGKNIALQGELVGPGVNGNKEKFDENDLYIFDIWDIDAQRYMTPYDRCSTLNDLNELLYEYGEEKSNWLILKHVPVIGHFRILEKPLKEILALSDRSSINTDLAEGIVYKSLIDGNISFKVISNRYLLSGGD
jgi:RNA ligase (TIGR02306 family)